MHPRKAKVDQKVDNYNKYGIKHIVINIHQKNVLWIMVFCLYYVTMCNVYIYMNIWGDTDIIVSIWCNIICIIFII